MLYLYWWLYGKTSIALLTIQFDTTRATYRRGLTCIRWRFLHHLKRIIGFELVLNNAVPLKPIWTNWMSSNANNVTSENHYCTSSMCKSFLDELKCSNIVRSSPKSTWHYDSSLRKIDTQTSSTRYTNINSKSTWMLFS